MLNLIECHAQKFLRFVDHHLQLLVKEITSYMDDTDHVIKKVNNFSVPVYSILVIMDVR